jgi:hypothetical protein
LLTKPIQKLFVSQAYPWQVGNTPQAFGMVGLVNTARQLSGSPTTTRSHDDPAV